jgi:hypothetical protein
MFGFLLLGSPSGQYGLREMTWFLITLDSMMPSFYVFMWEVLLDYNKDEVATCVAID